MIVETPVAKADTAVGLLAVYSPNSRCVVCLQ